MERKFTEIIEDVHPQLDGNHRITGDLTKMSTCVTLLKQCEPQAATGGEVAREKKTSMVRPIS